jgi:hypothetical protein
MQGTDSYVIYNIQIVKGQEALIFNIRGLEDDELTAIGEYNTMAFGKSTNDILLNIGIVPRETIVQVTYGISFTGRLTQRNEFCFDFPYNELNANTTAFMDVTIDNAAGVSGASLTSCSSTFSGGRLVLSHTQITQKPNIVVTTLRPIESTAISVMVEGNHYIGLSIIPEIETNIVLSEIFFLVDHSGSMSGSPIQCVCETLAFLTEELPSSCYFQVIFFDSGYECLFDHSVPKSQESLSALTQRLGNLTAGGCVQD